MRRMRSRAGSSTSASSRAWRWSSGRSGWARRCRFRAWTSSSTGRATSRERSHFARRTRAMRGTWMPSDGARGGMTPGGPILVIDTATTRAVIALGMPDGAVTEARSWVAGYRHGEELLARIEALLRDRGIEPAALGAIVVGTGPGAFTGLRVGLATAKGLAHALGLPIIGIPTGSALLGAASGSHPSGVDPSGVDRSRADGSDASGADGS